MKRTIALVILDGWGIGNDDESNPIHVVKPQNLLALEKQFPVTSLQASGISVGLPWGEVGNSEVGHLTLGAGRVVYQNFPRITMAIQDGSFFENPALKSAFEHARKNNSGANLIGLITKGTTHAALDHLLALIKMAGKENISNVKLHLFSDGKDGPIHSLQELLAKLPADKFSTLMGRYYGMDRHQNWSLTQKAYECLLGKSGQLVDDASKIIEDTYKKGLTEEFIPPLRFNSKKQIEENDAVIFFNFREDSVRQISESFISKDFDKFPPAPLKNLLIVTMTRYEEKFDVPVAFPPEVIENPLGKVISDAGKTQLRLAETYKYAHVTLFFNAYREEPFKNEYRVLIPSLNIPHAYEHPELMASAITDRLTESLSNNAFDFILTNYSNPDTIAHTGNCEAALEAVRVIDREVGRLAEAALKSDSILAITSDHGNIEQMINLGTGRAETEHDPNPVPFYLIGNEFKNRKFPNWRNIRSETEGILSDVAPTVLELMGLRKPPEMNGQSLLKDLI